MCLLIPQTYIPGESKWMIFTYGTYPMSMNFDIISYCNIIIKINKIGYAIIYLIFGHDYCLCMHYV